MESRQQHHIAQNSETKYKNPDRVKAQVCYLAMSGADVIGALVKRDAE